MHLNSELLFKKYALPFFKDNTKILEIGPAGHPSAYQKIVDNPLITWHTIDFAESAFIENAVSNLTYTLASPYDFPVEDSSYDIVLSGQVFEHVEKIWDWLREIKRILKSDGVVITLNPVSWPYHEAPIDCWRVFPSGINALAQEVGFIVQKNFFESLEMEYLKEIDPNSKFIPGQSYNYKKPKGHHLKIIRWNKFIRSFPI